MDIPSIPHCILQRPPTTAYDVWVSAMVRGNVRGRCAVWATVMARRFPELTIIQGVVVRMNRPPSQAWQSLQIHVWLLTEDGEIVDPTARQFGWPREETGYLGLLVIPLASIPTQKETTVE